MKLGALALLLCARVAAAESHATLLIDKCMLSVTIDQRVVYRGKPKCKNEPRELDIRVPKSRGVHVRTVNAAFYASAGFWNEHVDELLLPLVAGKRYEVGEGYAVIAGEKPPTDTHCVGVSRARGSRVDAWSVNHYGTRDGPFDLTTPSEVGGEHARHDLTVSDGKHETTIGYMRLFTGTYRFHVARGGKVALSFTDANLCAPP